jgi:26S proteasome regulatory subunit N8
MPPATTNVPDKVIVHPLVLLSAVDHYNRIAKDTKKRVVGVLLGQWTDSTTVNVSNSFAVPFEEDDKDQNVWFLDHNYIENMMSMFKKVNAKEVMVGWYHTGPKLRASDLKINTLFQRYLPHPVLVVINVQPNAALPTSAYFAVEEIHDDGTATTKTFLHLTSVIGAEEAEEIGVEHLLRDVSDEFMGGGTLEVHLRDRLASLGGLRERLSNIVSYLTKVVEGKMPVNHQIMMNLQDIVNVLPDISDEQTVNAFQAQTNDDMMVVYLASLVQAVLALHRLIDNKIENRDLEKAENVVEPPVKA